MRPADAAGTPDPLTLLVADCLQAPARSRSLTIAQWNALLRALRRNALLGTFAERLFAAGLLDAAPAKAKAQMLQARIAAASARTAIRFEVNRMLRALRDYDGPLVLLKGAAYELADLPPAAGRMTGDVDVMVPRARLAEVEDKLVAHGWRIATQDPYDERYYREWSHEIPPLLHPQRQTPIDLHHTIAPPTGRAHVDADALLALAAPTATPRLSVLGPVDMVLHSTLHLINDEVGHPLRDLFDLHLLVGEFGRTPGFWDALRARAELHGVARPLHYLLRSLRHVFDTPIPPDIEPAAWAPNAAVDRCMARLLRARFAGGDHRLAAGALYVRAHWLRMPPAMLAGHLARKGMRRARDLLRHRDDARGDAAG
jgi:hypothetical protein